MRLKDMPTLELPRERMMHYGVENLSNADLLSIVLRTGIKDMSVKDVALNILNHVGNINNLNNIGIRELSNIRGVGNVKALTLLAAIELGKRINTQEIQLKMRLNTVSKVHDTFKRYFQYQNQEKILAIFLDQKKSLIGHKIISIGTLDHALIHPRDIFNAAIKANAASVIIMHNHPSGDLTPSTADLHITQKLRESGEMLGIPLLDHIITNGERYYSFYDDTKENTQK